MRGLSLTRQLLLLLIYVKALILTSVINYLIILFLLRSGVCSLLRLDSLPQRGGPFFIIDSDSVSGVGG
jgi:hypothetical protein